MTSDDYMGLGPHMLMWEISYVFYLDVVSLFFYANRTVSTLFLGNASFWALWMEKLSR